ncbi:MAG: PTS sugar transporter subunit IIA [Planctomycetota bacterium]
MQLTDILSPDCVVVPLVADDKQSAIFQLAERVCDSAGIDDVEAFKAAIWQRETTRSTGFGYGVAAPHHRVDVISRVHMALGVAATPIDFDAVDKMPVDLIAVIASPTGEPKAHIDALSRISRMFVEERVRDTLRAQDSPEALYAAVKELEAAVA